MKRDVGLIGVLNDSVDGSQRFLEYISISHLTIEKDGKVIRTSVVSKSGNRAVDDAVTTFLANLKVVPVPQ